MNSTVRHPVVVVVLLVLCAGCGSPGPTSPSGTSQNPTLPSTPAPTAGFPPLAGPSRTFVFSHELLYPVGDFTKKSRFVLYDDGAFALQYEGRFLYRGAYTEVNGVITFEWEGSRAWGATGTLKGDSLTVQYNVNMQLSDFEDAAYALTA